MMNDKATVTMPLEDFDEMRLESKLFREIREKISNCFSDYECIEYAEPEECKKCTEENPDCTTCKIGIENPSYEETITLDVERLIKVCKRYALYGKDVKSDIDDIEIIRKTEKGKGKKPKATKKCTPKKGVVDISTLGGKSK